MPFGGVREKQVDDVPAPGPTRAAVHVRVSSQEQARGLSLDGQAKEVRAYCEAQGYRVVRLHKDVGSGRSLERDAYQLMIHHGAPGCHASVECEGNGTRFGSSWLKRGDDG